MGLPAGFSERAKKGLHRNPSVKRLISPLGATPPPPAALRFGVPQ